MTSLNSEEGENDAGVVNKENSGKAQWKKFAAQLEPVTAQEEYAGSGTTPQTAKALRAKAPNFLSDRSSHLPKSLTARSTDKTFFPAELPRCEPSKCSVKQNGIVKSYAANTNQGLVRTYNEDRVSIILNIVKPVSRTGENWPKCSFFGVYDGHGGCTCADFLRDNLHQYVIKEPSFPSNPREALRKGFESAEKHFLDTIASQSKTTVIERSGSCAIVVLIVGDMCYVANVGDSRAVLSGESGHRVYPLSSDHKPSDTAEQRRIIESGGKVYQSQLTQTRTVEGGTVTENVLGPHRVLPGRLSVLYKQVSRTFGDTEAKLTRFGGNPNVIIAVPDIKSFRIAADHDFILMASDGIFDKLSNRDVVQSAWAAVRTSGSDIHHSSGAAAEAVLRLALARRSLDNVTVVMVGLPGFRGRVRSSTGDSPQPAS